MDPTSNAPAFFVIMTAIFPFLFLGTVGFIIFITVRNYNKAKSMGKDPFTLQTEVIAKLADSKLLEGEEPIEQKLAKADELLAKGTITQAEHSDLRKTILKEF
jgi:hypothetical protein